MATYQFAEESESPSLLLRKKQLLINIVDGMAKFKPKALYAELPVSPTSYDEGFRRVDYRSFANAVNGVAWWLERTLGRGTNFETLAYIGPNDMRHNLLLLGAVKAGYKMLFTSPRYSVPAQVNLFTLVNCKTILVPEQRPPIVESILASHSYATKEIPTLEELLTTSYPHYPYKKSFDKHKYEPLIVLHTSGTTGMPKPIIWTHDWAASFIEWQQMDPSEGFESEPRVYQAARLLSMMPPFHAGHLFSSLLNAIYNQTAIIYPLSGAAPSAKVAFDAMQRTRVDVLALSPPYMEEISKMPDMLEFLSRETASVFYGGGAIPEEIGQAIADKVNLFNVNGSTEVGIPPTIRKAGKWAKDDWSLLRYRQNSGFVLRKTSEELYEAYIVRDHGIIPPVFKVFPDLEEYRTGDLFSRDSKDPDLWKYRGRADDTLIFNTGEMFHPVVFEQNVSIHPDVKAVLMVGSGRPQTALLVEPVAKEALSDSEKAELIERLWPTVEKANETCSLYAQVAKPLILITDIERPFILTAKGSISRKMTVELYRKELDQLYAEADGNAALQPTPAFDLIVCS